MYITQSLHRNLRTHPETIAVSYQGIQWTYREYGERVAKLAGALRELGVSKGERVAMLSMNSSRYLEYVMAVPWAGGALNPVNIRWSTQEIAYSLDDSETRILIVDDAFLPLMAEVRERSRVVEHVIYAGDGESPADMACYEQLLAEAEAVEDAHRCNDDLAGVFYTGGTTGFPKGVMLSHSNICSSSVSIAASEIAPAGCRFLHAAPMFHLADFAMVQAVFMAGGTHVVVPGFDVSAVLSTIEQAQVSDVLLVPTMVQMLLDSDGIGQADLSCLKRIVYGASPMPLGTLDQAMEMIPKVGFIQAYGMTELAPVACINGLGSHTAEARENGRIRAAGQPGILQEVKIVDEQGNEVLRHTVGEVIVRGPNVMLGYWGKPEATAEAIREGWMHTGDGGYMDKDGYVYIVDRVKDMIISGGENIYSAEVETAITQHPSVAQCAVIGIPSEEWGETVHAVVIPHQGQTVELEQLREHCKQLIAGYKCPRSLSITDAFPLSGAGKVLKTELRKPFWEGLDKQVG